MPNRVLTKAIDRVASGHDLGEQEAGDVLAEVMRGNASEAEIAGFLIALRSKGETVDELAGLAGTMRRFATRVSAERPELLDTSGTGGGRRTFNVSTTAALIAAGAGCGVAKHGNRSATSPSGSADLLEALGARIDLSPERVAECIDTTGFGFLFAPAHHAATRFVIPVRAALAVRTVFNLLGPLTNPAGATRQLVGVSDAANLERMAGALARLGAVRALVVNGADGVDELSTAAVTSVVEVDGGELRRYEIAPEQVGVQPLADGEVEQLAGGSPRCNAELTRAILAGVGGPAAELAALNAGAAIYAGGGAESVREGVERAREAMGDGSALDLLERFVERTQALAGAEA
ncbi:MAG: anthranilate phosphoribosyltransferase [Solirubrobacteraceae bacterium]